MVPAVRLFAEAGLIVIMNSEAIRNPGFNRRVDQSFLSTVPGERSREADMLASRKPMRSTTVPVFQFPSVLTLRRSEAPSDYIRQTPVNNTEGKRQCPRRSLHCDICMVEPGVENTTMIRGECLNISDDGLYAIVPIDFNIAAGQRYWFELCIGELGPEPGDCQAVRQQGVITRTELVLDDDQDRMGIGVHLIGQRSGIVPMPMMS